jgi:hypothetical protein
MPLGLGVGKEIAVLESKFSIYEELSKEMLDKLERAVLAISDNSNKIAVILERHENKLAESDRTDAMLLKMLEEVKLDNIKDHREVKSRISKIEEKMQDFSKFRWQVGGVLVIASIVFGSITSGIASNILTSIAPNVTVIENAK